MSVFMSWVQQRSQINAKSWHYRIVKRLWGAKAGNCRTWPYYIMMIPTAAVYIISYFTIYLILWHLVYVVRVSIGWFCGYMPRSPSYALQIGVYAYAYKTHPSGRKIEYAPWEFLLVLTLVLGIGGSVLYVLYLFVLDQWRLLLATLIFMVAGSALIFLCAGACVVFQRIWRWQPGVRFRQAVSNVWQIVCPPITVVETEQ